MTSKVVVLHTRPASGRTFRVGGPEPLTCRAIAATLTSVLGREVSYVRIPPAALAEGLNAVYGAPAGDHIAALYTTMAAERRHAARSGGLGRTGRHD